MGAKNKIVKSLLILTKLLVVLLVLTLGATEVRAQESTKLPLLATFNKYPADGYVSIWGYTAPDNREYAILAVQTGTSIIDITDSELREVAFIPGPRSQWRELKSHKGYAYVVTEASGGMQIIDLTDLPRSAKLINTYTAFETAHTIWIDETRDLVFVEGNGTEVVRILDIKDPIHPRQISTFGVECHDMFVKDNIAYVAEGWHGTWSMYDTTNPLSPTLMTRVEIPNGGYVHNTTVTPDNRHVITTEEVPAGKTLKVWDVSNLRDVKMVGQYLAAPNGIAHNAHIKGRYAYVAHYGSELRILDMINPLQPKEVAYYQHRDVAPPSYAGAWEVYPYFKSGKVIYSDMSDGMYVVQFDPGRE